MIYENKFFIFDNPQNKYKYFFKQVKYFMLLPLYKFRLNVNYPLKSEKKKYYTAVCAIFKNEANYLKEWIEFHKIIGIEHFYLYNNFSDDNYKQVLETYVEDKTVTLIEWPIKQGQMAAYKDCAEKYSCETNWIAYIDLDEFIVPNTKDNIKDILVKFEKNRPVVIAYWNLFGTSGLISREEDGLITEDFFVCWRKYTNIGKCFFNTAYEYADDLSENKTMHYRWSRYNGTKLPAVNFYNKVIYGGINKIGRGLVPIQINHYFTKSFEEYKNKASRGDAFFELNPRDEAYFYEHEMKCQAVDYNIRRFLIKLKIQLSRVS